MRPKIPKKLKNIPKRAVYGFFAVLILSSSYLWWRPDKVHAQTDTFTVSGTWTVPANVSSAVFEAWGGGGPGGGASTNGNDGGGGAGGQYATKSVTGLVTNDAYTITVATSVAGTTGQGSAGNDSQVTDPSSTVILRAKGGQSGTANGSNGAGGNGSTLNGIGDTVFAGGNGSTGSAGPNGGGGGGGAGSSGSGGNGGIGTATAAGSGTSSNGGFGGTGGASNANGNPGNNYGGGGGGAAKSSGPSKSAGAGAQGLVTVTYTPVSYTQSNYQWFANADNTVPGSSLASANTAATLTSTGQAFRLRQLVTPNTSIPAGTNNYDEQYAYQGGYGSCAAIPPGNWGNVGSNPLTPSSALPGGTITGNTGAGIYSWTNTGNLSANDGSTATVNLHPGTASKDLVATNFGFNIPAGATINGIAVNIGGTRASASGSIYDATAELIKAGTVQTADNEAVGVFWSTSAVDRGYGGDSYIWGNTWTPSDINDAGFGFVLNLNNSGASSYDAFVDSITMIVYYTPTGTGAISYKDNPTPSSGSAISWRSGGIDPTDGAQTITGQTYQEANGFTTTSTIGGTTDGEWDLSMYDNGAAAGSTFCFRTVISGGTAFGAYSQYPRITTFTPPSNSAPNTPTLSTPASGATGISTTPSLTLSTTDVDSDYVRYRIYLYQSDCSTPVSGSPFTQPSGLPQTGWSGQDAGPGSNTAYATTPSSGTTATYAYQSTLSNSTTYCWKADAIDPAGSNTYSSASATQTFTTVAGGGSDSVTVQGGVTIQGGSTIQ